MKFDLIISDYDGTLSEVGNNNKLSDDLLDAIKQYEEKGGKFVICSGRPFCSLKNIAIKNGFKGIVATLQGTYACDVETGKEYYFKGLSLEYALPVLKAFLQEKNATPIVFYKKDVYCQKKDEFVRFYEQKDMIDIILVDDLLKFVTEKGEISKIALVYFSDQNRTDKLSKKYNLEYGNENVVFNSGADYILEVLDPNFSKGDATKFFADYFSVPYEKIMTVGDNTNDISMVKGEWYGVATGDGHPELKKVAKEVTVPLKDKPIKYLIEKYCL